LVTWSSVMDMRQNPLAHKGERVKGYCPPVSGSVAGR